MEGDTREALEKELTQQNGAPARRKPAARDPSSHEEQVLKRRTQLAEQTYGRGERVPTKNIRDKKLRGNMRALERRHRNAALQAKDAEILLEHSSGLLEAEGELEKTYRVRQDEIKQSVGVEAAKKGFELKLEDLGPYVAEYTRNGRQLLLAGQRGHVATVDWREGRLGCEIQLGETVRDAKWLHNDQSFAVAQKKYVYIYDKAGVEIHRLGKHIEVTHMEFLPYHFLLATIGNAGHLKYVDTSTGQMVAESPTKLGPPTSMCQNPYNAILHVGHQKGTVTLWSPNSSKELVKLLPNRGPVRSVAVDRSGHYMVSTGQDCQMSIWDIRMFKEVHSYLVHRPGASLAISDRNLTAVGWGTSVSIWKDLFTKAPGDQTVEQQKQQRPYMSWGGDGQQIQRARWCPFEDVLGISHSGGFSSIIVPGAGEPNFDALEANPYETVKQRREAEVHSLLNKLQPEMISLNPNFIGNLDLASHETRKRERDLDRKPEDIVEKLKNRGRGKNGALSRHLRKKGRRNIIDAEKLRVKEALDRQNAQAMEKMKKDQEAYGPALARFARKKT